MKSVQCDREFNQNIAIGTTDPFLKLLLTVDRLSLMPFFVKTNFRQWNLRLIGYLGVVGKRGCCKSTDQPEQNYYPGEEEKLI